MFQVFLCFKNPSFFIPLQWKHFLFFYSVHGSLSIISQRVELCKCSWTVCFIVDTSSVKFWSIKITNQLFYFFSISLMNRSSRKFGWIGTLTWLVFISVDYLHYRFEILLNFLNFKFLPTCFFQANAHGLTSILLKILLNMHRFYILV